MIRRYWAHRTGKEIDTEQWLYPKEQSPTVANGSYNHSYNETKGCLASLLSVTLPIPKEEIACISGAAARPPYSNWSQLW